MSSTSTPLDIKVVYDSSGRSNRPSRPRPRRTKNKATASPAARGTIIFALLSLVVASAMYYTVCWPSRRAGDVVIWSRTPLVTEAQVKAFESQLQASNPRPTEPTPPTEESAPATNEDANEADSEQALSSSTARILLPATFYSWLVLSCLALMFVAMSSGTMLGAMGTAGYRLVLGIVALLSGAKLGHLAYSLSASATPLGDSWPMLSFLGSVFVVAAVGLAFRSISRGGLRTVFCVLLAIAITSFLYAGYQLWGEYGHSFPTWVEQYAVGAAMLLFLLVGLIFSRTGRGMTIFAGWSLVVAAIGSVVGLYLWSLCGIGFDEIIVADPYASEPAGLLAKTGELFLTLPSPIQFGLVFVLHSLWGWVLIASGRRIAKG